MSSLRQQICHAAASVRTGPAHNRRSGDLNSSERTTGLESLLWDGSQLPPADRGVLALQAFTQGDGYLPGQIIDRCA